MLTFAMRCNLGVTLTELTKPKNVTVARKIGSVTDDIETSLVNGSQIRFFPFQVFGIKGFSSFGVSKIGREFLKKGVKYVK